MITFSKLLHEIADTETFIVEEQYMCITEFIELIGEWNAEHSHQIKLLPVDGVIKFYLDDYDYNVEMTFSDVKKFVKHFESVMPHSWSALEFLHNLKVDYFPPNLPPQSTHNSQSPSHL